MHPDPFAGPLVTAASARAVGLNATTLRRARRTGQLVRVHRGLHLTAAGDTWLGRVQAAAAVSSDAVLSGASTVRLSGIAVPDAWPQEITVPPDARRVRSRPGLRVVVRPVAEVVSLAGLRSTSLARAVADIACGKEPEPQQWVVDQALRRGVPAVEVERHLAPGQRGVRTARRALLAADSLSESPLESAVGLALCRSGVPRPVRQLRLEGGRIRIDMAWPAARVALEADGVGFHSDPVALHRDRERQNRLAELGWIVVRCTWADLRRDPAALAALVTRLLHDRAWARRPLAEIDERVSETAG